MYMYHVVACPDPLIAYAGKGLLKLVFNFVSVRGQLDCRIVHIMVTAMFEIGRNNNLKELLLVQQRTDEDYP